MTDINFREATIKDCPALARVHVQSWRESFAGIVPQAFLDKMSVEKRTEAFQKRFPDNSYRMFVAEAVGRGIVGFADFGRAREMIEDYEGELYAIYILPEFHRRGIGRTLFKMSKRFLLDLNLHSMYLLALKVNPYRSFYEKMGGRIIGSKQVLIEGVTFDELIYGWDKLSC